MPAVVAFAAALAAGSVATWWASRNLAPRGAESRPRCRAAAAEPVPADAPPPAGPVQPAEPLPPQPAEPVSPQPTPADAPQPIPPQPPPTAAGAPPVHMGLPQPPYAGSVPQWRLDRAETAGRFARDKLDGRVQRVPETPAGPPGPKSIIVVARAVHGDAAPGIVAGPWSSARGYVTVQGRGGPAIHDDAVFHGFHSREEAESYWNAAFPRVAVTWLPLRP